MIPLKNYTVYINDWNALRNLLDTDFSTAAVLADENTEKYCLPTLRQKLQRDFPVIIIPSGETYKNLSSTGYIWEKMISLGMDRHSLLINLGGGVIGDMGGWAASTYMRGIDFIQIPTTLLSMVDSSVGGKLGIDFHQYKNLIGLIKDPAGVYVFTGFLSTLENRQLRSGFAEMIKHGLIRDYAHFEALHDKRWEEAALYEPNIIRSIVIKKEVVEKDPLEKGLRKILNFGHTIGHAIESFHLMSEEPLLHGEAIAIGMIIESKISELLGFLSKNENQMIFQRIVNIFGHHPGKVPDYWELHRSLSLDKKNQKGNILYTLLKSPGEAIYNMEVERDIVSEALQFYNKMH